MRRLFLLLMIAFYARGDDCDHTWTEFMNKEDLLSNGIDAGEFKPKVYSYVGRFVSQKGLNPGRIQVSPPSIDIFLTSSGKVKKFSADFEFLRRNENFTYAWVKGSPQKCLNTAVTVDDKWMIGRTTIEDFSYLGKVRVGSLGMLYEDHFGREILTDDYEILTCNANPLKKLVEETKTENLYLKNEVKALNQKLIENSKKLANSEDSSNFLSLEIQNLNSEVEILKAGKEMLITLINNLKSEVDLCKKNAVKAENDHMNEIKLHNFEKDSLKSQVEEKTQENQRMRIELDEWEEKHGSLTEEIEDLNLRIENAAKDHTLEVKKLENKIQNLEEKYETSNGDSEISENCEQNPESDQLGIELKIFNFYMIELRDSIALIDHQANASNLSSLDNHTLELLENHSKTNINKVFTAVEIIFSNEVTINCYVADLNDDEQLCEVNLWINRHFNTKINNILMEVAIQSSEDFSNPFQFFNFALPQSDLDEIKPDPEDSNLNSDEEMQNDSENVNSDNQELNNEDVNSNPEENIINEDVDPQNITTKSLKITEIEIKNQISWFIPQNIGKCFPNLKILSIINSQFLKFQKYDFENMENLITLKISENQVDHVPHGVFINLPSLEEVDLSSNHLFEVDTEVFKPLLNLKILNLENNDGNFENMREASGEESPKRNFTTKKNDRVQLICECQTQKCPKNSEVQDHKQVTLLKLDKPQMATDQDFEEIKLNFTEGRNITIECPLIGTYTWRKDGRQFISSVDLEFKEDGRTLFANKATGNHSGFYSCIAKNDEGRQMINFEVIVSTSPKLINLKSGEIERIDIKNGNDVMLQCLSEGNPKPEVYWVLNKIGKIPKNKVLKENQNILIARNIEEPRSYYCHINNTFGFVQKRFLITPFFAPEFKDNTRVTNVSVVEGNNVVLSCDFQSQPKAIVTWTKDSKPFNENIYASGRLLEIKSSQVTHNGTYTCLASNEHGSASKTFNLFVQPAFEYLNWTDWSRCGGSCDVDGSRFRIRYCRFKGAVKNIQSCPGEILQLQPCDNPQCLSKWSEWSDCPSCYHVDEENLQTRTRKCLSGNDCKQSLSEMRSCNITKCKETSDWGEWKVASKCGYCYRYGSKKPKQKFLRICENPSGCIGDFVKYEECKVEYCRGNHWGNWSDWSACKGLRGRNCGLGTKKRARTCLAGKRKCFPGSDFENGICQLKKC